MESRLCVQTPGVHRADRSWEKENELRLPVLEKRPLSLSWQRRMCQLTGFASVKGSGPKGSSESSTSSGHVCAWGPGHTDQTCHDGLMTATSPWDSSSAELNASRAPLREHGREITAFLSVGLGVLTSLSASMGLI